MTKDDNNNVINMFSAVQNINGMPPEVRDQVKFYAGFNYVKHTKDVNGNTFNKETLPEISKR